MVEQLTASNKSSERPGLQNIYQTKFAYIKHNLKGNTRYEGTKLSEAGQSENVTSNKTENVKRYPPLSDTC